MVDSLRSLALFARSRTARPLALLTLLALLPAARAAAAPRAPAETAPVDAGDTARGHHVEGRRQFVAGRYEAAITEYRRAYELHADPSYLLDIAEAYRALGVPEQAVFFYRRYLTNHPNPPNRPEVLAEIAHLAPPPRLPPRLPSFVAPPPPARDAEVDLTGTPAEKERSVVGRWWFWTAIGALAAAGATVAIVASSRRDDSIPSSKLGNAKLF
jgi:tetratricopeptide (TPR) repeat protein